MNADRRARQRDNHIRAGNHSSDDHEVLHAQAIAKARDEAKNTSGPVNCPVCRPRSKTWDRDLAGKAT